MIPEVIQPADAITADRIADVSTYVSNLRDAKRWPQIEEACDDIQRIANKAFGASRGEAWYMLVEAVRTISSQDRSRRLAVVRCMESWLESEGE